MQSDVLSTLQKSLSRCEKNLRKAKKRGVSDVEILTEKVKEKKMSIQQTKELYSRADRRKPFVDVPFFLMAPRISGTCHPGQADPDLEELGRMSDAWKYISDALGTYDTKTNGFRLRKVDKKTSAFRFRELNLIRVLCSNPWSTFCDDQSAYRQRCKIVFVKGKRVDIRRQKAGLIEKSELPNLLLDVVKEPTSLVMQFYLNVLHPNFDLIHDQNVKTRLLAEEMVLREYEKFGAEDKLILDEYIYICPSSKNIRNEVHRILEEFNKRCKDLQNGTADPISCAAWIHYELAKLHPFGSVVGKTARILMNLFLMLGRFPPILFEDEVTYDKAIHKSIKAQSMLPFQKFIHRQIIKTEMKYTELELTHGCKATVTLLMGCMPPSFKAVMNPCRERDKRLKELDDLSNSRKCFKLTEMEQSELERLTRENLHAQSPNLAERAICTFPMKFIFHCGNAKCVKSELPAFPGCAVDRFKYCGACFYIKYCSRKCQKNDFKTHKHECEKIREGLERGEDVSCYLPCFS